MRRRTFVIGTIACCLDELALATRIAVSQEAKIPRIGVLTSGGPGRSYDAIRQGFAELGYVEGKTIILEPRFAQGQSEKLAELATELVRLNVDTIATTGAVGVRAARDATDKIPIVFSAVLDPVALGYVASLERPGGNVTGITSFDPQQATKQFEILKEIFPKLARVAILSDQNVPRAEDGWNPFEKAYDTAARAFGWAPLWIRVKGPAPDLQGAFVTMMNAKVDVAVILEVPVILLNLKLISDLAVRHRVAAMFPAGWPDDGLVAYGTSMMNATSRIPVYVDRILKGGKPAEMPIEFTTRRELVINLKIAREIDVTIPLELLQRADRVVR